MFGRRKKETSVAPVVQDIVAHSKTVASYRALLSAAQHEKDPASRLLALNDFIAKIGDDSRAMYVETKAQTRHKSQRTEALTLLGGISAGGLCFAATVGGLFIATGGGAVLVSLAGAALAGGAAHMYQLDNHVKQLQSTLLLADALEKMKTEADTLRARLVHSHLRDLLDDRRVASLLASHDKTPLAYIFRAAGAKQQDKLTTAQKALLKPPSYGEGY